MYISFGKSYYTTLESMTAVSVNHIKSDLTHFSFDEYFIQPSRVWQSILLMMTAQLLTRRNLPNFVSVCRSFCAETAAVQRAALVSIFYFIHFIYNGGFQLWKHTFETLIYNSFGEITYVVYVT